MATAFGFDDEQFRPSNREMIEHYVDGKAARMQGITMKTFSTRDYARLDEGTPHDRVPHKNGNYPTPPGKCEFVKQSRAVNRSTQCRVTWRRKGLRKRTQKLAQRFPLNIVLPRSHGFVNSCYANEVQKIEGRGE